LARHSDFLLHTPVVREADPFNLIPTTSTTVQMALGDAVAIAILHKRRFSQSEFAKYHPGGALGKRLLLKTGSLLDKQTDPPRVHPDTPIREVIYEITKKRLGATAVMENGQIRGIITDGDIRRMLQKISDISGIVASDIMTKNPKTVHTDDLASDAMKKMKKNNINQLIVLDPEGKYAGIIHIHELLKEGII
jgi:arabinose-5-phosphate isomerase